MADPRYDQMGVDPYGINPFADEGTTPDSEQTPFADQLPFRFTQFAINPATQATTGGQVGRSAVARSPFTSGALARELSGLRSQISEFGNMQEPTAPNIQEPVMPTMPDMGSFISTTDLSMTPTQAAPPAATSTNFAYGLPTKTYELPRNLALVGGQSPIAVAQEFEKVRGSLSPDQLASLGEMTQVQGYDLEQILGTEKYNELMGAKNIGEGEQMLLRNLGVLPTNFDPMLYKTGHLQQLASRPFYQDMNRIGIPGTDEGSPGQLIDFNEYYNRVMAPPQSLGRSEGEEFFAPLAPDPLGVRGSGIQRLGDTGLYFDPTGKTQWAVGSGGLESSLQNTQRMLYNDPEASGFSKFAQIAIPTAAFGGMAAITGGAAGTLAGGAGIGSALGLSGGYATAANAAAGLISSIGLSQAAQQMGLPTDHPLMRAGMAIAGGAAGGMISGAGSSITAESMKAEQLAAAQQFGMSESEYATKILQSPSIDAYVNQQMQSLPGYIESGQPLYNISNSGIQQVTPDVFMRGAGGIVNPEVNLPQQGLRQGMGLVEAGVTAGTPIGNFSPGMSVEDQMRYQMEMDVYNQGMEDYTKAQELYNQQIDEWNRYQGLQENYATKMAEYMGQREKYTNLLGLRSRQAGLTSDIAGLIASNPYYQPELDLTGIQSRIV